MAATISILVPEFACDQTVQSVKQQTHTPVEIIPAATRNAGLDKATGDYVAFIEDGDTMADTMMEQLLQLCEEQAADIAECQIGPGMADRKGFFVTDTQGALEAKVSGEAFSSFACNKLYRLSLFRNIRFPLEKRHRDEFTIYRTYLAAEKLLHLDVPLYFSSKGPEKSPDIEYCQALRRQLHRTWDCGFTAAEEKMNPYYAKTVLDALYLAYAEELAADALDDWRQMESEHRPLNKSFDKVFRALERTEEEFMQMWGNMQQVYQDVLPQILG